MISIYEHPPESESVPCDLYKLINSYNNHWDRFYYRQVTYEETKVGSGGLRVPSNK